MNCRLAELARKQNAVNIAPHVNTELVNTETDVNTQAVNAEPVNCLRCAALEARIAELEASLVDKPKPDRKAYMRDYMKRRRARG